MASFKDVTRVKTAQTVDFTGKNDKSYNVTCYNEKNTLIYIFLFMQVYIFLYIYIYIYVTCNNIYIYKRKPCIYVGF